MTGSQLRQKYLNFFKSKNHKIIAPAPLVLKDDPSTLFTSSGMQPLIPHLLGAPHKDGKRLTNSQPCLRVQDIEEVGDNRHTTFFEMLGNWSLGDYFKKEQLPWIWEFVTKQLNLPKEKLYISVFEGDGSVKKDEESLKIWKSLRITDDHIFFYGVKKNWWSRTGTPSEMPEGEIGGPDSEIFFEFEEVLHDPKFGEKCHPNCDCGKFMEITNSVFIQYKKENGKLVELPQKNVDFGGGLERMLAAINNNPDVFKTDLFWPITEEIEKITGKKYSDEKNRSAIRIIADHIKASCFLISNGVIPSNKAQGYILRRLIRRASLKMKNLKGNLDPKDFQKIVGAIINIYKDDYFQDEGSFKEVIAQEITKFSNTLDKGMKLLEKVSPFDLFQSYGFPIELTEELYKEKGLKFDKSEFQKEFVSHQNLSRAQSTFKVVK
ncbi:MAG: hypothetical protein HY044_01595 [Candidatus Woesebacteria bacterium]|nr:MAG: hypothetical protein HY044_01595 [Candidatus Woesebacteria bacterium]